MPDAVVRLLHVKDEPTQHKVLLVRLEAAAGLRFEPTWVTGEGNALEAYAPSRFDLVVMDYMLEQGDGLHLYTLEGVAASLCRLRGRVSAAWCGRRRS